MPRVNELPAAPSEGSGKPTRRRRLRHLVVLFAMVFGVQLVLGASPATAHDWSWWHWDRGGSYIPIYIYNYASLYTTADNARKDIYYRPHPLYLYNTTSHTDISVFDTYEPSANYCGLAEIIDWRWWTPWTGHILHAHARYNRACGYGTGLNGTAQGVFCQEIAHTLGLDHANTGDCMGLSYYAGSAGRNCFGTACDSAFSHPAIDLYNKYRFH